MNSEKNNFNGFDLHPSFLFVYFNQNLEMLKYFVLCHRFIDLIIILFYFIYRFFKVLNQVKNFFMNFEKYNFNGFDLHASFFFVHFNQNLEILFWEILLLLLC